MEKAVKDMTKAEKLAYAIKLIKGHTKEDIERSVSRYRAKHNLSNSDKLPVPAVDIEDDAILIYKIFL